MAGRGQATLHLDGKEIFSIQLNEPGKVSCMHLMLFMHKLSWRAWSCKFLEPGRNVYVGVSGKVSDRIAELRGEVMTKLNAHMGANTPVTDEGKSPLLQHVQSEQVPLPECTLMHAHFHRSCATSCAISYFKNSTA